MSGPLLVLGDALLDRDLDGRFERLCPDAPVPVVDEPDERRRPGGAALAAALTARDGRSEVVLVTALADDEPGQELARLLDAAGVRVIDLGLAGRTPEKIRVRTAGRSLLRLDRGGEPGAVGPMGTSGLRALAQAGGVLVSDYGCGLAAHPSVREALGRVPARVPLVWDPHPTGGRRAGSRQRRWRRGSGRAGGRWSPPAAASTWCTPATSPPWRRPGGWATA
jgi:D-beta-D-heptose 7-phosphate kinase / D-beta-D-heptose 1-phosphate adenosyltransferase